MLTTSTEAGTDAVDTLLAVYLIDDNLPALEHAGLDVDRVVEYHARAVSCHRGDGRNGKGLAVDYDGLAMPVSSGVSVLEYVRG